MAQLAFGLAGAGIGFFLGGAVGAQIGFLAGSALGSVLFPVKTEGPRLTDLKLQKSQYGGMIPILYGTTRIGGNVIWQTDLIEHESTSSPGKGGPQVTNFSYTAGFAIRLCEGPVAAIHRVWADGRLIANRASEICTV